MQKGEFGFLYHFFRWMLKPWTSRVRSLNPDLSFIAEVDKNGQAIYVGSVASFIDFLILNELLEHKGFKTMTFTHGVNPFWVLPFAKAWRIWSSRLFQPESVKQEIEFAEVISHIENGESGFIFLKRGPKPLSSKIHYYSGLFGRIASLSQESGAPIHFIPTAVFLTRMRNRNSKRSSWEILLGTYDFPSRTRKIIQLFKNVRRGGIGLSKSIDLGSEMDKFKDLSEKKIDKKLRWTLLFHLDNEDRAYRGPTKRSVDRKVRKILKERRLNEELEKVAERTGRSVESVRKEAEKTLKQIASDSSERVINVLRAFFSFVWSKTTEGLDIRPEDIAKVRQLTKQGPVIFLPCHRSHVDYLVFAYTFEKEGLNMPKFAAGDNLSKWPLGSILRRAGAFFIRRSFKGEVIFPLVFEAYIRHVLRERNVMVFFMEGGRSRTGKLLQPKIGMMAMILDAWQQGIVEDLPLVPVTIDYGKVFEGQSYIREKSGAEKQAENLAGVFKSRKVLNRKHGWIRMRFGDPLYLKSLVEEEGLSRDTLGFRNKIPLLQNLSTRVLNDVNKMVTLTAGNIIAGILMGNPRRGMAYTDLRAMFVMTCRYLDRRGVELAFHEKKLDMALNNALDTFENWETIVRVELGDESVINIPEEKRIEMEYYKNNGLHFILDLCLYAVAYRYLPSSQRTPEEISRVFLQIFEVLDMEFVVPDHFGTPETVAATQEALISAEVIRLENGMVRLGDESLSRLTMQINDRLLLNFLESYFVVADMMESRVGEEPIDMKQLVKALITRAKLLYAVGTLQCQESVNKVTLENALTKFNKLGLLRFAAPKGQKHPNVGVPESKREKLVELKKQLFAWMSLME